MIVKLDKALGNSLLDRINVRVVELTGAVSYYDITQFETCGILKKQIQEKVIYFSFASFSLPVKMMRSDVKLAYSRTPESKAVLKIELFYLHEWLDRMNSLNLKLPPFVT